MTLKFENEKLQERFEEIEPEFRFIMRKRFEAAMQIAMLIQERGITQKEFAAKINKNDSEVSRWLNGVNNITLDTIALIEFHFGKNCIMSFAKDNKNG